MDEGTRETLVNELTAASSPREILLVEMKFAAAGRYLQQ